jgi:hypothetical protein
MFLIDPYENHAGVYLEFQHMTSYQESHSAIEVEHFGSLEFVFNEVFMLLKLLNLNTLIIYILKFYYLIIHIIKENNNFM